jgi:hypothetical protein
MRLAYLHSMRSSDILLLRVVETVDECVGGLHTAAELQKSERRRILLSEQHNILIVQTPEQKCGWQRIPIAEINSYM